MQGANPLPVTLGVVDWITHMIFDTSYLTAFRGCFLHRITKQTQIAR